MFLDGNGNWIDSLPLIICVQLSYQTFFLKNKQHQQNPPPPPPHLVVLRHALDHLHHTLYVTCPRTWALWEVQQLVQTEHSMSQLCFGEFS